MMEKVIAEGEHERLPWRIIQTGLGHLCGYVGIPECHLSAKQQSEFVSPCSGAKHDVTYDWWNDKGIEVHGGLTFSQAGDGDLWPEGYYWLGFDCAHRCDDPRFGGTPKDADYVERECLSLARQVANILAQDAERT
jgi:hypothetical protein